MSIKITDTNYETYKKVFALIGQHLWKETLQILKLDTDPIDVLNKWETESKSLAKKGLQSGLNDTLTSLRHCPKAMLSEINDNLEKQNLPNLKTMLKVVDKTVKKVLTSQKIKSLDDYYIIKELLDDSYSEISAEDRSNLSRYFLDFELRASK